MNKVLKSILKREQYNKHIKKKAIRWRKKRWIEAHNFQTGSSIHCTNGIAFVTNYYLNGNIFIEMVPTVPSCRSKSRRALWILNASRCVQVEFPCVASMNNSRIKSARQGRWRKWVTTTATKTTIATTPKNNNNLSGNFLKRLHKFHLTEKSFIALETSPVHDTSSCTFGHSGASHLYLCVCVCPYEHVIVSFRSKSQQNRSCQPEAHIFLHSNVE